MKRIDIVVPIYNAYDDLVKCVTSVKKHTDLKLHRLILINDCSTDERILPYIRSLESESIIVIDNEQNAGFSNNVNKGMSYSKDRDVLLLNSDTIVTARWIEKIVACAYSKPEIGTVTPMSNSATLCSYPVLCQDNDIPEHWTIDGLASVVERCSMHMYPRITVAVGFCMFIKRETIEKVGLFDAVTFERGYGEENDFCNRAEQLGYIHVMCDDTFIYHRGTASFQSEQKQDLIRAHEGILQERYPAQMERNSKYCNSGLDQYIRENIHIYAKANPKKKNLMYLLQADFREDAFENMGGTQHHVRDLTMQMKDAYNVYVVARDRDYLRVTMYSGSEQVSLKYYIGEREAFPRIHDTEIANLLRNILVAFRINVLHVHHVYGIGFDIFDIASELEIPIILSMHDHYYVCPSIRLLDVDHIYCGGHCEKESCAACLKKNAGIYVTEDYLKSWHENCRNAFSKCEKIIVPSQSAKDIYLDHYPELIDKIEIIEHGLEIKPDKIEIDTSEIKESFAVQYCLDTLFSDMNNPYTVNGWGYMIGVNSDEVVTILEITCGEKREYITCTRLMRMDIVELKQNNNYTNCGFSCSVSNPEYMGKELKIRVLMKHKGVVYTNGQEVSATISEKKQIYKYNVAFLGGMLPEKGSKKACEMIQNGSKDICWHIFGSVGDVDLINLQQENLVKHGTYKQQDVPQLLSENNIDIVCILSILPETFCYTLSESVYSNVPIFATDIGASGERVKRHQYGWTVPVDATGAQMSARLLEILENQSEYAAKKETVTKFNEITFSQMAENYKTIYQTYQCENPKQADFDRVLIFKGLGMENGVKNTPYLLRNLSNSNEEFYQEMEKIWDEYQYLKIMKQSKGYRLIEKLRDNPLVRTIYKLIR